MIFTLTKFVVLRSLSLIYRVVVRIMAIRRMEWRKNTAKPVAIVILQFSNASMSQMTSRRALYGNFRLPFIIETINFEQGYLVKFSPEKLQNLIERFSQCICYE